MFSDIWKLLFGPKLPKAPVTLGQLVVTMNVPWSNPLRGSVIHKIDAATAAEVALLIENNCARAGISVAYLAACICQESKFDPGCYDQNGVKPPTFPTTDWGIGQASGAVLLQSYPGTTVAQLQAWATDPSWAIPKMTDTMRSNLDWASTQVAGLPTWVANHTSDPVAWLATYAYNSGRRGALEDIAGPHVRQKHADSVMGFYVQFLTELGEVLKGGKVMVERLMLQPGEAVRVAVAVEDANGKLTSVNEKVVANKTAAPTPIWVIIADAIAEAAAVESMILTASVGETITSPNIAQITLPNGYVFEMALQGTRTA